MTRVRAILVVFFGGGWFILFLSFVEPAPKGRDEHRSDENAQHPLPVENGEPLYECDIYVNSDQPIDDEGQQLGALLPGCDIPAPARQP